MPPSDDRTPGLANALFGPRLGRPVFVAARTSTPLPMSVTDPATNFHQFSGHSGLGFDRSASAAASPSGVERRQLAAGERPPRLSYLILVSLKATCLRATGSYFLKESFSVAVRGFFLVT